MFSDNDEDEPASIILTTSMGGKYDIHNISGKSKAQLIAKGLVNEDTFNTPANMPGKKLKAYREAYAKRMGTSVKPTDATTPDVLNTFKVGDLVKFRGTVSEVIKVHPNKGVLVHKREGGKTWIQHSKVEVVAEPKEG